MPLFPSSYMPTNGATVTRNADALPLPFPARPQAMTAYVRFVEMGSIKIVSARVWQISNSVPLVTVQATATGYQIDYSTADSSVTSTLAVAPSIGDRVELLATLTVDGKVQINQSLNGAAIVSAAQSGAQGLLTAWGTPNLYLNDANGVNIGFIALREITFHRGVQSIETMRRLAGVI